MKKKNWLKCLLMVMALIMTVGIGTVSTAVPAAAKTKAAVVKVGTKFKSGKFQYKVTSLKGKKGTAALIGTTSKNITSATMPQTVKKGKYTLTVNEIGASAFKNCRKLKSVVTNNSVKKIGKSAFAGCSMLTTVNIKSKALKSVGSNALKGVPKKANVIVPNGKKASYKKMLKVSVRTVSEQAAAEAASVKPAVVTVAEPTEAPAAQPAVVSEKVMSAAEPVKEPVKEPAEETAPAAETTPAAEPAEKPAETTPVVEPTVKPAETTPVVEPTVKPTAVPTAKPTCQKGKHLGLVVVESVAPTCTEPGLSSYEYCTVCGYETKPIVLSAPGHDFVHHEAVAPTCTRNGWTAYDACKRCGYATGPEAVEKLPHDLEEVPGHDATCTARGWKAYKVCRNCSYQERIVYTPALGHDYSGWQTTVEPNCTQNGTEKGSCTRCGAQTTRSIPAKGHSYGEGTLEPLSPDSCYGRYVYQCEVCQYVKKSDSVVHRQDIMESLPDIEPTCTTSGRINRTRCKKEGEYGAEEYKYVKPLGHNFCTEPVTQEATCTADGYIYRKCSRCDERVIVKTIPKIGHTWTSLSEEATCEKDGFNGKECSVCGAREGNTVYASRHHYTVTVKEATCDAPGLRTESCSVCGDKKETVLPVLEHRWIKYEAEEATCGKGGHSAYEQCARCNAYKDGHAPEITSALAHKWEEANAASVLHISQTVADSGKCHLTSFVRCTNCGIYKVVPGPGHSWLDEGKQHAACGFDITKSNADAYIHWTVFLSETGWQNVAMGNQCSTLWMNGKTYAGYIPAVRSSASYSFVPPVPNVPDGKVFKGWKQVLTVGDGNAQVTEPLITDPNFFNYQTMGQTYVAVIE